MSKATHGGKGDRPRVIEDRVQFDNNWDKIFGKKAILKVMDEKIDEKFKDYVKEENDPAASILPDESWLDDMLDDDLDSFLTSYVISDTGLDGFGAGTQADVERKLKEWGMMYDCLQNMAIYEYPVEEAKELLKRIKV